MIGIISPWLFSTIFDIPKTNTCMVEIYVGMELIGGGGRLLLWRERKSLNHVGNSVKYKDTLVCRLHLMLS